MANLDSDCYNSFSELILDLNNLMEVKLNDSDSDLLFIKSIIKDSIDYAVLFSKQKNSLMRLLIWIKLIGINLKELYSD